MATLLICMVSLTGLPVFRDVPLLVCRLKTFSEGADRDPTLVLSYRSVCPTTLRVPAPVTPPLRMESPQTVRLLGFHCNWSADDPTLALS